MSFVVPEAAKIELTGIMDNSIAITVNSETSFFLVFTLDTSFFNFIIV
jgi:hypothetical protein